MSNKRNNKSFLTHTQWTGRYSFGYLFICLVLVDHCSLSQPRYLVFHEYLLCFYKKPVFLIPEYESIFWMSDKMFVF